MAKKDYNKTENLFQKMNIKTKNNFQVHDCKSDSKSITENDIIALNSFQSFLIEIVR